MAAATNTAVSVPATAGEGGSWGMALLAAFSARENRAVTLSEFLDEVIGDSIGAAVAPDPDEVEGFNRFFRRYTAGLPIERAAVEHFTEDNS
jgi:hypothetical protein